MAPPNEVNAQAKTSKSQVIFEPGEEIVISGLSGRFPSSDNVYEFRDKLFNKVDLITDHTNRWKMEHSEIPRRLGVINHLNKFDASYFGVHLKLAHIMDPMGRLLLERAYEAIIDAGYNPAELRGKNCGVFMGVCFSESERTWFFQKINVNGFGIAGSSRTILANRISYWLGVHGPSLIIDSACSSSLYAVDTAYRFIKEGICDMAIVGSSNLCLHPYVSLQFFRLGVLSPDGSCKSFDNKANGYCRSEAVPVIFLQKAKDARRIYATVVHSKTNCDGYKELGITYPSGLMQYELLREFYEECNIDPTTVDFIEAHGTGTKVGDPEECNALDKIFCTGRKDPLLIGSIKSSIGHSEPASGICSITKSIITMESGFIPPNLHFDTPREGIPAFSEGRLKVVTEKLPWSGSTIGVNSFGFGGANCHVLLKWNEKEKINFGVSTDGIPRLVGVSGRTEEAVETLLDQLKLNFKDAEYIRLFHDIHALSISGHIYRGYTVLTSDGEVFRDVKHFPGEIKELCLVFSGAGSYWPQMGKHLMKIPAFSQSVEKSHAILAPFNVNLKKILTEGDSKIFDDVLSCFVAVAAVQVGLTNIMNTIGLRPQYIFGHSIGELGCAYADGCLTAEQVILCAYYMGLAFAETGVMRGALIDVGAEYAKIKDVIPREIDVAYRNNPNSCVLSGPAVTIKKFSSELLNKGIRVEDVPCSNIPFHSRYVKKVKPKLLEYLSKVIPISQSRTSKWICSISCSSVAGCSPEYFAESLLSPVFLSNTCSQIPKNVIVVEALSDSVVENVLKQNPDGCNLILPLFERKDTDHVEVLLKTVGELFEVGFQPQLANLYPSIQYPVSRGTPMISPFVKWEHSRDWYVPSYESQEKMKSGDRIQPISLKDEDNEYISGHVIDGRVLFPATGYLALVWETFALFKGGFSTHTPIVFENVKFNRATTLPKDGNVQLTIMVQKGSGKFEITEGGSTLVNGKAYVPVDLDKESSNLPENTPAEGDDLIALNARDIYKELRLRGYQYKGVFRGLVSLDGLGRTGKITWAKKYVAFMDNMLQTLILQEDTRSLYVPTALQKVVINPFKHQKFIEQLGEDSAMAVHIYKDIKTIVSGGIEIVNLRAAQIARKKPLGEPVLERYVFMAHITRDESKALSFLETFRLCIHLILENVQSIKVKVVELGDKAMQSVFAGYQIAAILGDLPLIQAEITILAANAEEATDLPSTITIEDKKISAEQNCLVVVASSAGNDPALLQQCVKALKPEGYLILRENPSEELALDDFNILVDRVADNERILLLQSKSRTDAEEQKKIEVMKISENDSFQWVETLKSHVSNGDVKSIILVAEKEKTNGLIGFTNCLRKEPGGNKVRCVFIFDQDAPAFDLSLPLYEEQLKKGLAMNVLKDGEWGTFRHEALPSNPTIKAEHGYFNTECRGDLSSFKMYAGPLNVNECEEPIVIYYSSINFRDVMLASGKLGIDAATKGRKQQEIPIGLEFSGRLKKSGRRVMGMIVSGALASMIPGEDTILWDVPDEWTLEQAATIPIVYSTVYMSLMKRVKIKKGQSILIHSGTGGVGLAALNLATTVGCNIFTTVGTPEKREYLKKFYPHIPDSHIGNSRDTSFEDMINRETNRRGVDCILNSLSEEKLQASLRCLAPGGKFVEIGKFDLSNDNPLDMEFFESDASFHGVHLDTLLYHTDKSKRKEICDLLKWGMETNGLKPLKTTVFDYTECEQAFRYLTTGKHIGKVLLKLRDEEPDKDCLPGVKQFDVVPKFHCAHNKSYIILGGLGGFGLELADWLVMRGAQKIVLNSRTGLRTGYQSMRIRIWREYGVTIKISTENITTDQGVINLLKEANGLGPVDAIFNLAVVLRDALFENQTEEAFCTSFGPKAVATRLLDKYSRQFCPFLKHFVIFSSVSCGRGNAGQTNYGMANSVMERICESRVEEGYPGLAIQWGAIGEVGLVAEMQEDHQELVIGGTLQQTISSCLKCLDQFLSQKHPVVASMVVAEKKLGSKGSGNIVDAVVNILGIDLKTVSTHATLAELGMDSMMAVEIKQTLEREFDVYLTAQDMRNLTFAKLAQIADVNSNQEGGEKMKDKFQQGADEKVFSSQKLLFGSVADEESSKTPCIPLENLGIIDNVTENLKKTYGKVPPVFFLPGIDGAVFLLEAVTKKFKYASLGLHYPYNDPCNTDTKEIASRLTEILKLEMTSKFPIILVAYSAGSIVAIEIALTLEKQGFKGYLFFIDGAPDYLKKAASLIFGDKDSSANDSALLYTFYNVLVGTSNASMKDDLGKYLTWEDKLNYCETIFPDSSRHTKAHLKVSATDFRRRLMSILNYEKSKAQKLSSFDVILFKPKMPLTHHSLPEDYNLSEYCTNPVKIVNVDGNHMSMLEEGKISDTINQFYTELALSLFSKSVENVDFIEGQKSVKTR